MTEIQVARESESDPFLPAVNAWLVGIPSPTTNETYARCYMRTAPVIRDAGGPDRITTDHVSEFTRELAGHFSPATVNLTLSAMSSLWRDMQRRGLVQENPWRIAKRAKPKQTRGERILRESEVREIILSPRSSRDRALLRFLYVTGARVSEAVSLRWRDFRTTEVGTHYVTFYGKGGKTRAVIVPTSLYNDMLQQFATDGCMPDAPAFPARHGRGFITRQRAWQIVREAVRRSGLDVGASPHWLRHAHATHALRHGARLELVQATLGHSSIATTGIYAHVEPGESSSLYVPDIT